MYNKCVEKIALKKEPSLLISLTTRSSNTIKRAILSSAEDIGTSQSSVMNALKEKEFVKEITPGKYALTARGIIYVEFELCPLGVDHYIKWIDEEYLQIDNEPISDKNRVILLALFSTRCFTEETCATYSDNTKENAFINMLQDSYNFLSSMQLVKADCLDIGNSKSKSRISIYLSQIDKLPSSTGMKFVAKDKKYYVDVLSENGIDRQSITFITKIIMGNKNSYDQIDKLEQFCEKQYMKYGYIFTDNNQSFTDSISLFQIKNGIEDATC